VSAIAHL
jgi:hypothetical protein